MRRHLGGDDEYHGDDSDDDDPEGAGKGCVRTYRKTTKEPRKANATIVLERTLRRVATAVTEKVNRRRRKAR